MLPLITGAVSAGAIVIVSVLVAPVPEALLALRATE